MAGKRANGAGSLTKTTTGKWIARVTIESKRVNKTFSTYKAASEWLSETVRQAARGLTYDATRTCLAEFLDSWLEVKKSRLRLASSLQYEGICRLYLKPYLGRLKLREVTPAKVQAFYDGLLAEGKGKRTIQIVHTTLRGALNHARRLGLIVSNPVDLVQAPRPEKREMSIWDEGEVNSFLAFMGGDVFYRVAFSTGMRQGELFGLKWEDLNWKTGMLQVRRQVYRLQGGGWRFQEPKTWRGKRSIRLGPGLLAALREHFTTTIPRLMAVAGDKWEDHDLIFPNTFGNPLDKWNETDRFQRLAQNAGLKRIRFHDIRHTCASLLLAHGEPPVRVAAMLGQSIAILLETYAHYIPDDSDSAALLMDEITTPTTLSEGQIKTVGIPLALDQAIDISDSVKMAEIGQKQAKNG